MEQYNVKNEKVPLLEVVGNRGRLVALSWPRYFAETLEVFDKDGNKLVRNQHYVCRGFNGIYGAALAADVCSEIIITDTQLTEFVTVNYVALPTQSLKVDDEFIQKLKDNQWRNLPVEYHALFNKPRYYPPSDHSHQFYDLYYWDDIGYEVSRITRSVASGRSVLYDRKLKNYQDRIDAVTKEVEDVRRLIEEHAKRKDDPHNTTSANLIGANGQHYDQLPNLPEAMEGDIPLAKDDSLVTVSQMMRYVDTKITQKVKDHINKTTGNVHKVTAKQADTYDINEVNGLLSKKLHRGSSAKNALTINGKSIKTVRTQVMSSINTASLQAEPIPPEHLAKGATGEDYMLVGSDGEYAEWAYLPDLFKAYIDYGSTFFYHEFKNEWRNYGIDEIEKTLNATYPPGNYQEGTVIFFNHIHRYDSTVNTRGHCTRYIETLGAARHINGRFTIITR